MDATNLTIMQGATWRIEVALKDATGTPIDITNCTGRCQIRKTAQSAETLAAPAVTIVNAEAGRVAIVLTATETAALPATGSNYSQTDKWTIDALLTFPGENGDVRRILQGMVQVSPGVTR